LKFGNISLNLRRFPLAPGITPTHTNKVYDESREKHSGNFHFYSNSE
jgi:hypothetical protein